MQSSLFPLPPTAPFQRGSPTSRDAALSIAKDLNALQRVVYLDVLSRGAEGSTYRETMARTGLCSGTVTGRINALKEMGLLVATTRRRGKAGVVVESRFFGRGAA